MTLRPPFLHVFPGGSKSIVTIPIPPLVPRNSYTGHTMAAAHPFLPSGFSESLQPVSLNRWQPAQVRPGIDVLTSEDFESDFIIHFSSTDGQMMPPQFTTQARHVFEGISLSSINVVPPAGDAVVCRSLTNLKMDGFKLKLDAFPQHVDGHFLPSHSRTFVIDDPHWTFHEVVSGPMCPISGSVLLNKAIKWGEPELRPVIDVVIAIASFD